VSLQRIKSAAAGLLAQTRGPPGIYVLQSPRRRAPQGARRTGVVGLRKFSVSFAERLLGTWAPINFNRQERG
jgi:hypothetical protein